MKRSALLLFSLSIGCSSYPKGLSEGERACFDYGKRACEAVKAYCGWRPSGAEIEYAREHPSPLADQRFIEVFYFRAKPPNWDNDTQSKISIDIDSGLECTEKMPESFAGAWLDGVATKGCGVTQFKHALKAPSWDWKYRISRVLPDGRVLLDGSGPGWPALDFCSQ
jgi:hypothetical protein